MPYDLFISYRHADADQVRPLVDALKAAGLGARRRILGDEHPGASIAAWNLFRTLESMEDDENAKAVFRDHLLWLINRNPESLGDYQRRIREMLLQRVGKGEEERVSAGGVPPDEWHFFVLKETKRIKRKWICGTHPAR